MKIGFYTSTFNDRPLEEVLDFAKDAGFDAIEIDVGGHIKTPDNVAPVRSRKRASAVCSSPRSRWSATSSIPTPANARSCEPAPPTLRGCRARRMFPILVIFPGRDSTMSEEDNYKGFAELANELIAADRRKRARLRDRELAGPEERLSSASTPAGWKQLFDLIPDNRFGLEFDPSHLIRLGIDPYAAFEGVKERDEDPARQGHFDRR